MAVYDIDKVIASGEYDLVFDENLGFEVGEALTYRVLGGGVVQEDMSVPVLVEIKAPPRLAGTKVKARLVPSLQSLLGPSQLSGLA